MDIWTIEKLSLFLIFFVPGFISVKIYQLLVPSEKPDFTKSFFEVIGFSCVNLGLFSWLILIIFKTNLIGTCIILFYLIVFFLVFISPIILSYVFVRLSKSKFFNRHLVNQLSAWDYIFLRRESYWVFITLRNGEKLIGRFATKSYVTSNSNDKQIFIEEVWKVDADKKLRKVDRTKGILIFGSDILTIEFKI